jgi:general secretion pathway protein D
MRWLPVVLVVLVPFTAVAETTPDPVDESLYSCKPRVSAVEITLKPEIELKELLTWAVGFTCKKFVFDPRIVAAQKKVTLIAPGKQTPAQAYDMFTTALATMGYTVVPKGKMLQIVESTMAKTSTPKIYRKDLPSDGEQVVRYLMRPQYAQPETLRQAVSAFKSDAGDVQAIGSLLLITDHANNIRDMESIAKLVDVPGGSDGIYAIPIHHADAGKLAEKLSSLLDISAVPKAGATKGEVGAPRDTTLTPSKLLVDDRTNTLIVSGTDAAYQRVRALVDRLDISLEIEGGASMHVYQLGSAIAEELAKTLNEAIQAQSQGDTSKRGAATPAAPTGDVSQLQGPVRIISDKPTNKLIVMSSGRDFIAIRDVIRELDIPRRQVYIEAMILEVNASNGLEYGSASHGAYVSGDKTYVGGVQMPQLRTSDLKSTFSAAKGLIGGLVTPETKLFGLSIPSYAVLFQAVAEQSRTNILSTMPIIVVDNELAKYKVGTNVPFQKGVLPTSTTSTQVTTNIEREPLALELEIKPHISTDDSVLLEVKQGMKDRVASQNETLGPTWTERSVETRVLVGDQQTIVLGGMMQERETSSSTKVPLLGDIPVLGNLFKYTTKSKQKMNLLILLTPYIIKSQVDLQMILERKQREHAEFAGALHHLNGQKYLPRVDYTRKRGVVEEINRTLQDIEDDIAARRALRKPVYVKPGLVEPSASVEPQAEASPTSATSTAGATTPTDFRPPWMKVSSLLR